jgi:ElaB/YqjD/DUF883 family membrane-anchored ribosome-binding protein
MEPNMPDHQTATPKSSTSRPEQLAQPQAERAEPQEVTLGALQRQFSTIAGEVGELARLVRGGAHGAVANAVDRVSDVGENTAERAKELEERAVEWVKERPIEAALLSMGVGALLWSLLRRS